MHVTHSTATALSPGGVHLDDLPPAGSALNETPAFVTEHTEELATACNQFLDGTVEKLRQQIVGTPLLTSAR